MKWEEVKSSKYTCCAVYSINVEKWHIQQAKHSGKQNTLPLILDSKVVGLN